MGRGGLDEYEAWLDSLDAKCRVLNGEFRADLDLPLSIPLSECNDVEGLVKCAIRLKKTFSSTSSYLPQAYLIKRFIRLAIKENHLSVSSAEVVSKLPKQWNLDM